MTEKIFCNVPTKDGGVVTFGASYSGLASRVRVTEPSSTVHIGLVDNIQFEERFGSLEKFSNWAMTVSAYTIAVEMGKFTWRG